MFVIYIFTILEINTYYSLLAQFRSQKPLSCFDKKKPLSWLLFTIFQKHIIHEYDMTWNIFQKERSRKKTLGPWGPIILVTRKNISNNFWNSQKVISFQKHKTLHYLNLPKNQKLIKKKKKRKATKTIHANTHKRHACLSVCVFGKANTFTVCTCVYPQSAETYFNSFHSHGPHTFTLHELLIHPFH